MVAADDGDGVELADAIDDLVRRRAVADEVAEDEEMVPGALGVEHGRQGVDVGVNVRDDQVAHRDRLP